MNTEGKPVDSVIQYQLHRKVEGGGSGDCKVKLLKTTIDGSHICTQEDIDFYGEDTDGDPLVLGSEYTMTKLNVTYEDCLENTVFIYNSTGLNNEKIITVCPSREVYQEGEGATTYGCVIYFNSVTDENFYCKSTSNYLARFRSGGR